MRHARRSLAAAIVVASFSAMHVACVGDDPDTGVGAATDASTDTGTSNESGLAGDAAPSLGCPLGCLPPAPSGWTGPSAVYDGPSSTKPAACPATYTQKELEAFQGMDAGAAQCNCGAPTFTSYCSAFFVGYSTSGCTGLGTAETAFTTTAAGLTTCSEISEGVSKIVISPPELTLDTCTFPSSTSTLPDAGFTAQQVSCGLPQNAACATSSVCVATPVPDAPFTRLCIHKDGDTACPSADYSQRFVSNKNISDSRSCTACSGTPADAGTCGTTIGVATDVPTCMATPPSGYPVNTCVVGVAGHAVGGNIAPTGLDCLQDGGAPGGTIAATDPVTFCCNK
jgi:hypothetical protein